MAHLSILTPGKHKLLQELPASSAAIVEGMPKFSKCACCISDLYSACFQYRHLECNWAIGGWRVEEGFRSVRLNDRFGGYPCSKELVWVLIGVVGAGGVYRVGARPVSAGFRERSQPPLPLHRTQCHRWTGGSRLGLNTILWARCVTRYIKHGLKSPLYFIQHGRSFLFKLF